MGLFTRAQVATMRDRTRRRNYSAEAEEFRREHARHREWGLTQRHARKLSRLHGSTANAAVAFQHRVDELTSASCSARAITPISSEPVGPEPPASAPAVAEPVGPRTITSEQAEPVQAKPEQAKPEGVESEGVADAARVSGPSGPGNASRCPDRRFCSSRPGRHGPGRPGRPPGSAWKGPHRPGRPDSTRHIRPRTDPESPQNQARRHAGTTGVNNARQRRRTPLSPRPNRTTSPIPKDCRDHTPP